MRSYGWVLALGLLVLAGGCAEDKEWMKIGQPYTTDEFRRDWATCSKSGSLDEDCLRSRGWVSVTPGKPDKPVSPTPPVRPPGRY